MKCTWFDSTTKSKNCEAETGRPCPAGLEKHVEFSPKALWIFFQGTPYETIVKEALPAFVCEKHRAELDAYLARSTKSIAAAKKRARWDGPMI